MAVTITSSVHGSGVPGADSKSQPAISLEKMRAWMARPMAISAWVLWPGVSQRCSASDGSKMYYELPLDLPSLVIGREDFGTVGWEIVQ